jgi:multimeric flavodoxin WrbA
MENPKHLLIVFHSQTGHTEAMAQAVIGGASDEDIEYVELRIRSALKADADDVKWADAIILGTPENFGYMSGAMKYFFDRIYYECIDETQGLPYALFIRAGNDGTGAFKSMERIITGLKWRSIHEPVIVRGEFDDACLDQCREFGMLIAAGLEAGVF